MKFALFNQLQMPRPWRQHEEVLMYKEAITEAVHAEAVALGVCASATLEKGLCYGKAKHEK